MPVAFSPGQGAVTLSQTCDPTTLTRRDGRSTCTVTAQNLSFTAAPVNASTHLDSGLRVTAVSGATETSIRGAVASATLAGGIPVTPSVDPGSDAGYVPLDAFGVTPFPVGDEQALNFNVPAYRYGGEAFTRVGITSDGYLVAGGAAGGDIQFDPLPFPDTARPNNVLAPLWTDLDGTGTPGIFITVLTDGASRWIMVDWRLNTFGTSELQVFQAWLGINGTEQHLRL